MFSVVVFKAHYFDIEAEDAEQAEALARAQLPAETSDWECSVDGGPTREPLPPNVVPIRRKETIDEMLARKRRDE